MSTTNQTIQRPRDTPLVATTAGIARSPIFSMMLGIITCLLLAIVAMGIVMRNRNGRPVVFCHCDSSVDFEVDRSVTSAQPGYLSKTRFDRSESQSDFSVLEAGTLTSFPKGLQVMNRSTTGLSETGGAVERDTQDLERRLGTPSWYRPQQTWSAHLPCSTMPRELDGIHYLAKGTCRSEKTLGRDLSQRPLQSSTSRLSESSVSTSCNLGIQQKGARSIEELARKGGTSATRTSYIDQCGKSAGHAKPHSIRLNRPTRSARQPSHLSSGWIPDDDRGTVSSLSKSQYQAPSTEPAGQPPSSRDSNAAHRLDRRFEILTRGKSGRPETTQLALLSRPYELSDFGVKPIPTRSLANDTRGYPWFP